MTHTTAPTAHSNISVVYTIVTTTTYIAQLGQVILLELQRAQALLGDILPKMYVIAGVDEAVAIHHLSQRLWLVLQGVWSTQREIVVHVRLAVRGDASW